MAVRRRGAPETPRRQGPPGERRAAGGLAHGGGRLLGELWVCPGPGPPAGGNGAFGVAAAAVTLGPSSPPAKRERGSFPGERGASGRVDPRQQTPVGTGVWRVLRACAPGCVSVDGVCL